MHAQFWARTLLKVPQTAASRPQPGSRRFHQRGTAARVVLQESRAEVVLYDELDLEDALLLQGFSWDSCRPGGHYKAVKARIPDMKAAGVTHIWLPPPSQSVSPEGYLPGQLYNLESAYGSKEELVELVAALKAEGIHPLADIVINHRCAQAQDEQGRWNNYQDDIDHEGHRIDWGRWAICGDDPFFGGDGNADTGATFWGAPDLDHSNAELRDALCHWLQHLHRDIGFTGWRFDFVKGYAPRFVKQYVDESVGPKVLNIGELWVDLHWESGGLGMDQDPARQALCDWVDGTGQRASAFDFVTKGVLQEAVKHTQYWRLSDRKGKAPGLIGWWPQKAVTFVDNHDTGGSQNHWPFPGGKKLGQGYAYILTHPGNPTLFWEHFFDYGDELCQDLLKLTKLRLSAGIKAGSKMQILCAEHDMYVATVLGSASELTVKLGPRFDMGSLCPKESDGWALAAVGHDWAVWERKL